MKRSPLLKPNYPAVRAFQTALKRSARYASQLKGAEADRQIDGGEWSNDFHEAKLAHIEGRMAAAIAPRFGMTRSQLQEHTMVAGHEQGERLITAHMVDEVIRETAVEGDGLT